MHVEYTTTFSFRTAYVASSNSIDRSITFSYTTSDGRRFGCKCRRMKQHRLDYYVASPLHPPSFATPIASRWMRRFGSCNGSPNNIACDRHASSVESMNSLRRAYENRMVASVPPATVLDSIRARGAICRRCPVPGVPIETSALLVLTSMTRLRKKACRGPRLRRPDTLGISSKCHFARSGSAYKFHTVVTVRVAWFFWWCPTIGEQCQDLDQETRTQIRLVEGSAKS